MSSSSRDQPCGAPKSAAPRVFTLPLSGVCFDQIKAGTKAEEYRLVTPFWSKRLVGRDYDQVVLTRGYPKASDNSRRLVLPFFGYRLRTIIHPHFGPDPVEVFAIWVATDGPLSGQDGTAEAGPGMPSNSESPDQ